MQTSKKKSFKVGQLKTGEFKGKPAVYIELGNTRNSNPEYNYSVEFIVKDSKGAVVHKQENGLVFLNDPRTFAKDPDKIPAFVRYELNVSPKP